MGKFPQRHPNGLRYLLLWVGTWIIRLPMLLIVWHHNRRRTQKLINAGVICNRILVRSRDANRSIKVDVYEKADQSKSAQPYVHLNVHGSGFIIPLFGTDIDFCAALAAKGIAVFDTDYRKAPEHPFPAAYNDIQDVFNYIHSQSDYFDVAHITVGGSSAAGNLTMALSVNSPTHSIAGVISFYGSPDLTSSYPAPDSKNYDGGVIVPDWVREFFYKCYILPGQDMTDSRLSPVTAGRERWPRHVLMTCGTADNLYEPARLAIEQLVKAGHEDAEFMPIEREAHEFDKGVAPGSVNEKRRNIMYQKAFDLIERAHRD